MLDYKAGLAALRRLLGHGTHTAEAATLEARLLENLRTEQLYGSTETLRSERASIIHSLNRLALEALGVAFNDLMRDPAEDRSVSVASSSLFSRLPGRPNPSAVSPPVQTRVQALPFQELTWEQFEVLSVVLVEAWVREKEGLAVIDCHRFGVAGDDQEGIDIVARKRGPSGEETWVYQCKNHRRRPSAAALRRIFEKMSYSADYYVTVLSMPATAALREVARERKDTLLWDARDLSSKLKYFPRLVEDFFGLAWRQAFNG